MGILFIITFKVTIAPPIKFSMFCALKMNMNNFRRHFIQVCWERKWEHVCEMIQGIAEYSFGELWRMRSVRVHTQDSKANKGSPTLALTCHHRGKQTKFRRTRFIRAGWTTNTNLYKTMHLSRKISPSQLDCKKLSTHAAYKGWTTPITELLPRQYLTPVT